MKQKSNYSKFLTIWSGQLVSAVGSSLTSFGLGVYVFQKTGSAAGMALVALLAFLPTLLLSAPAGVLILIIVSSVMTCFIGAMQILAEPMILDFQTSSVLGITETICACGMLASSIVIGAHGLKRNFTGILSLSLALAGLAMIGFGWQ